MNPILQSAFAISDRALFGLLALMSLVMMLVAYFFFQKYLVLLPCPLCVTQRIFAIGFGFMALVAALHNPRSGKRKAYATLTGLLALGGASIAGRQVWLQSLPEEEVPACGPTLPYLLEYFPFQEVLAAMFLGEGSCAEIKWQWLGLSIPGWTLVAFIAVTAVCLRILLRREPA